MYLLIVIILILALLHLRGKRISNSKSYRFFLGIILFFAVYIIFNYISIKILGQSFSDFVETNIFGSPLLSSSGDSSADLARGLALIFFGIPFRLFLFFILIAVTHFIYKKTMAKQVVKVESIQHELEGKQPLKGNFLVNVFIFLLVIALLPIIILYLSWGVFS